ncbi:MAG: hypothetical protein LBQ28_04190 [Prevotellaceae bacterium]|jgi:hypothetical protein|nr:hypothetical protein [Prevotellaceae bacterium]
MFLVWKCSMSYDVEHFFLHLILLVAGWYEIAGQAHNAAAKTKTPTEFETLSGLRLLAHSLGNEWEQGISNSARISASIS